MMMFNTTKSLLVALVFVLMCFWAFGVVRVNASDVALTQEAQAAITPILGSLEFATKLAGAKLIVIMGHTECGAVRGACDRAHLGLLTAALANLNPAVDAVQGDYKPRNSENDKFVQAVAEKNVRLTMQKLRTRSNVLRELIDKGEVGLVGAMYNVRTGKVTFYE
ncbi:MAG: carbonic anhydrase [Syntrophobacterales bacterium]